MRIAHIVSTYPPYYGGMGNVVFQTASYLSALGHEVEVFTPQYYQKEEIKSVEEPVAEVHEPELEEQIDYARRLKTPLSYGNAAYMPSLAKELDRFDIVHLHYPFFGTANIVRKWKRRHPEKKLVITYHMDNRAVGWKGLFFKYYASFWLPKVLGSADLLIGSSLDYITASDAGGLYRKNPDKWIELPFGVDIERFKPREKLKDLFVQHNLDNDKPIVVFVGGMDKAHYFKGVEKLLGSILVLKKKNMFVQAVLVGDGDMRERYELVTRAFGLADRVAFAGRVSDEELPYYYAIGDVTVLPSTDRGEAFGMVLLESMACGVPVIASDLPGVRTVAQDGGMVVEPNNSESLAEAIAGYFVDDTNRADWRATVRNRVEEKYSWEKIVKRLDCLYRELV